MPESNWIYRIYWHTDDGGAKLGSLDGRTEFTDLDEMYQAFVEDMEGRPKAVVVTGLVNRQNKKSYDLERFIDLKFASLESGDNSTAECTGMIYNQTETMMFTLVRYLPAMVYRNIYSTFEKSCET